MKKVYIKVSVVMTLGLSLITTSCIGSFSLTNQLLSWNKTVSNKFVNELVFIAFCVIPVYEVTAVADILVLNSIEFWSGKNPVTADTRIVEGSDGKYLVESDSKGYTITSQQDGSTVRLDYNDSDDSWSVQTPDGPVKFMSFVDTDHVKLLDSKGQYQIVELSQAGVMAYQSANENIQLMASK